MSVTGTVYLDLSEVPQYPMRHPIREVIEDLRAAPDGATVVLIVPPGMYPPSTDLPLLLEHVERLTVDIHSTASTVAEWVRVIREGEPAWPLGA